MKVNLEKGKRKKEKKRIYDGARKIRTAKRGDKKKKKGENKDKKVEILGYVL